MKDLSERLWPAFRAEVAEQLEALELLLVQRVEASGDAINAMFRHFHTIKGGCAMMGFANMGTLAHAAEDALDPVRRNERALDESLVDVLLAAADALRQHLQDAERTRKDGVPREDIVARLRAAHGVPSDGLSAVAGNDMAYRPSPDDRAALDAFAVLCRMHLGVLLAGALQPTLPPGLPDAIAALRAAAPPAGLPALAQLLSALAKKSVDARQLTAVVADIVDRLAAIELERGIEAGTQQVLHDTRALLRPRLVAASSALADALDDRRDVGMPQADRHALSAADDLLALVLLARLPETTRLLRLVCQVLRDVTHRGLQPDTALLELLVLAAGMPLELQVDVVEDVPYGAMSAALYQRLQVAASEAASGRSPGVIRRQLEAVIEIRPEWLDGLAGTALQRLADAIARGANVVEIEADMEAATDNGSAFVAWLDASDAQIGNQTVFHREVSEGAQRESTRLRFLTAWHMPLDSVRHALGKLDPAHRLFDLRPCPSRRVAAGAAGAQANDAATEAPHPAAIATGDMTSTGLSPAGALAVAPPAARAQQTLRVESEAVDQFVNRIGELVTLRNMMAHVLQSDDVTLRHRRARSLLGQRMARQLSDEELDGLRALLSDLDERHERLMQADQRIHGALGRMQEDVLALRVVPVGMVFNRLPRVVRDLAQAQQKQVHLEISGEDVRVDKSLVDILIEPLMHLVRNAIDHGLETPEQRAAANKPALATLSLSARQQGGVLFVEVADDGRGLDLERIRRRARDSRLVAADIAGTLGDRELANLIFLPGFSTAEQVTEVSGRGVGMDVVKTRIAQVGGQVEVSSRPGQGTIFTLKLPLSVAIQSVVLVAADTRQFALPERCVTEILSLPVQSLQSVQGQACCLLRGAMLPVYALGALLGHAGEGRPARNVEIVVLSDGTNRIGLLVDRVIGRPEVFVREVHDDIARLPGVGGVSILGDGQVVIILDGDKLLDLALHQAQALRSLLSAS